ncbi:MAG: hypothetical protein HY649_10395 [Acidobacteria bacterium]|nr:hypothetical protein [Acidobacteriota bacterium]
MDSRRNHDFISPCNLPSAPATKRPGSPSVERHRSVAAVRADGNLLTFQVDTRHLLLPAALRAAADKTHSYSPQVLNRSLDTGV